MFSCNINTFQHEMKRTCDAIESWSQGKEQYLNLIAPPYNTSVFLSQIMLDYAAKNRSVLYITGENEKHIELLNYLKDEKGFKGYMYVRSMKSSKDSIKNADIVFSDMINAKYIIKDFELVIYDNVRSCPEYDDREILFLMQRFKTSYNKQICYSIRGIFKNARELSIPVRDNLIPIKEPRFVVTKIDLNYDIPFVIYDYLNWSIEMGRKVVIYLPSEENVKAIYDYLYNFKDELSGNIMYFLKSSKDKKSVYNFAKTKKSIMVTDDYDETYLDMRNIDVIVYFADSMEFDQDKLLYLSGKVGRGESPMNGEVIFLANSESESMEEAKNMARNFNKEAWERGLFHL